MKNETPSITKNASTNTAGDRPKLIVVCGPTATGKSDLAVDIALWLKGALNIQAEIISADSRQVYRGLDLGTGKITQTEMKGIPHHLLDIVDPMEQYTVADFKRDTEHAIEEITARGNLPILCGGTGMYIDAVVFDQRFAEVAPNPILRKELEAMSLEEVQQRYFALIEKSKQSKSENENENNPDAPDQHAYTSLNIDIKNKRRLIRAIEILEALGHIPPIETTNRFDTLWLGLDASDEILRERIRARINKRIEAGMLDEPKRIVEHFKIPEADFNTRMQELGLEYLFLSKFQKNEISLDEFRELLFFAIWHYAKRQRTWLKRNPSIDWYIQNQKNDAPAPGETHHFTYFKILVKHFLTSDSDFDSHDSGHPDASQNQ